MRSWDCSISDAGQRWGQRKVNLARRIATVEGRFAYGRATVLAKLRVHPFSLGDLTALRAEERPGYRQITAASRFWCGCASASVIELRQASHAPCPQD